MGAGARRGPSWMDGFVRYEPQPGVSYPEVMMVDEPARARWRVVALGVGGSLLGIITFTMVAPVVNYVLLGLSYQVAGSPGGWADYLRAAASYAIPAGMAANQLGLATLIPISMALVLFVHRFHPRWLNSVQPGLRWRYLVASLLVGLVILVGIWALSRLGQSWVVAPEPSFGWYLAAILITSPLQAAAEEYFFRGYLIQALHTTASVSPWFGVIGSSLVFALMHGAQDLPLFLDRLAFGLMAGVLVVKTGGLEAGIAAHVVNNVVAFGYAAVSGTMVATKAVTTASWADMGWNLLGFAVFGLVAWWVSMRMRVATATPGSRFGGPGTDPVK